MTSKHSDIHFTELQSKGKNKSIQQNNDCCLKTTTNTNSCLQNL